MRKTINKNIKSFFRSKKINVFLLFFLVSFLILVLTKLSKNYTNTITFNINKLNIPEDHIILKDSLHKIDITFKTNGFKFLRYYFKTQAVDVNFLKDLTKNDSVYIWNKNRGYSNLNAQFDKNIELINISPDSLLFRYDVNDVKKIPVTLNSNIKFSPGFDLLNKYEIQPDSIKVIGPKILLSKMQSIETDSIVLNQVESNINEIITLKIDSETSTDLAYSHTAVVVIGQVNKFTEGVLKIPIIVKNIPDDIKIKYFPKSIDVSYYTSLANFKNITKDDFIIECDFSKVAGNNTFLIPEIILKPNLVKHVKMKQQRIEFIIRE